MGAKVTGLLIVFYFGQTVSKCTCTLMGLVRNFRRVLRYFTTYTKRYRIKGISSVELECRNCAYIQFTMCIYGCIGDNYRRIFQCANQRTVSIFYIVWNKPVLHLLY